MSVHSLPSDTVDRLVERFSQEMSDEAGSLVHRLREQLRDELQRLPLPPVAAERSTPPALARSVAALRRGQGQGAILRSALAGAASLGARAALLVVKPDRFEIWDATGFEDDPGVGSSLEGRRVDRGDASFGAAVEQARPLYLDDNAGEPMPRFGQTPRAEAALLPLRVQQKVAAVLYVDPSDERGVLDRPALEVLVEVTALAVERLALARLTAGESRATRLSGPVSTMGAGAEGTRAEPPAPSPGEPPAPSRPAKPPAPSPAEPPAPSPGEPPAPSPAEPPAPSPAEPPAPSPAEPPAPGPTEAPGRGWDDEDDTWAGLRMDTPMPQPPEREAVRSPWEDLADAERTADPGGATGPPTGGAPSWSTAPDEEESTAGFELLPEQKPSGDQPPEVEDARRFARLLVEEICLYHGPKVEEGRNQRDLRDRLAQEIEQARKMYEQRITEDVRRRGPFFEEALVQVLAGGDSSALA
jgi:hypothetical protein